MSLAFSGMTPDRQQAAVMALVTNEANIRLTSQVLTPCYKQDKPTWVSLTTLGVLAPYTEPQA